MNCRGQVMLITVLVLSGTILATTAIAGLLMLYQIRQSTDILNSNKAIFAADSGLEWRLYKFFKADGQVCRTCEESGAACPPPALSNNAVFEAACVSKISGSTETVTIRSRGTAVQNSRAFKANFSRIFE